MCHTCRDHCRSEVLAVPNVNICFSVKNSDCYKVLPRSEAHNCYDCLNHDLVVIRRNLIGSAFNDAVIKSIFGNDGNH